MYDEKLVNKYLAWMIMSGYPKPLTMLKTRIIDDGKRSFYSYVPLVDITVYGIDEDSGVALDLFFKTFDKTIENYIKDKDDIKKKYRKQVRKTSFEKIAKEIDKRHEEHLELFADIEEAINEEGEIKEA